MISLGQGLKGIKYYIHQEDPFEELFENATSYQEIQQILANLLDDINTY